MFTGWQTVKRGDIVPLYNVTAKDHPLYRSTVSDITLQKAHLRVPHTPTPYPSAKPSPWHRVGKRLNHPASGQLAIKEADLDFTVVKDVTWMYQGVMQGWATVRTDTKETLAVVTDGCVPVQNRDAFTFFDPLIMRNEAIYESAGALDGGKTIWLLAKLTGYIRVKGKDIVSKYLLLLHSHDGGSSVRLRPVPIRAVCNNTLTAALHGIEEVKVNYTLNPRHTLNQLHSLLGWVDSLYGELDALFNRMAGLTLSDEQVIGYLKALVPEIEESMVDATHDETLEGVLKLHTSGQGASLGRGTLWGAFNAVVEYIDHIIDGEDPGRSMDSAWIARKERLKLSAFQLADRMLRRVA